VPPAVANAVYDAVGVRIDEVPITPEKSVQGAAPQAKGRGGPLRTDGVPGYRVAEPTRVPPPWEGGDGKAVEGGKGRQKAAEAARR